jgi:peptide/nickel transport system permease protein
MTKYIIRRFLYMFPILIGVTLLTFLLFNVVGGNPALQAAGKHATAERVAQIERELGTDKPLPTQYINFLKQVATFDYGRSWTSHQPIATMISDGIGPTLSLTLPAFFLICVLSITMAMLLAYYRGGVLDRTVMIICLGAMSLSSLVYILYMQYGLAFLASIFPISGWDDSWSGRWEYVALPMLIFIAFSLGANILFYRTVFLDEMYQDYVRTARAKGLNPRKVLFKHVLRNALIPIITMIVLEMPFLILGSLLLESFFGIPGLGGIVVGAIANADFPVIKAMTVLGAIVYMVFQLFSDILYAVVDPKIQLR